MILGGILGVAFVRNVRRDARGSLQAAGTAALAGSVLGMIGVGIFFLEHTTNYLDASLHGLAR